MATYAERLTAITSERGALAVGIDPHPGVLDAWDAPHSAAGLERVARGLVETTGDLVATYKPQSAFFEAYGSAGVAVLERVLADIAQAGALSILDVKRGDIGSTMDAYAQAYLVPGAPLSADAITVSPFLGFGSLRPAFDLAVQHGRGVYVLARTSNPEGAQVQFARGEDGTIVQQIIDASQAFNTAAGTDALGLVVGGTHAELGCDLAGFTGSLLVPGIGAQGGRIEDLPSIFGDAVAQVLPAVGRGVIGVGSDRQALRGAVEALVESIRSH